MKQLELARRHKPKTKGDEPAKWRRWFNEVARVRAKFADYLSDEEYWEPLSNETASMSVLTAAAARAGLLAVAETVCWKHDRVQSEASRDGRLDLWVADPEECLSWAFEAKQIKCGPGTRLATLEEIYARARHDAWQVPECQGERMGLVVATVLEAGDINAPYDRLKKFAESTPEHAWEIGGVKGTPPVFIFIGPAARLVLPCD